MSGIPQDNRPPANRPNANRAPPRRLHRQRSFQRIEENQQGIGIGLNCCTIPVAIAALVIASNCNWNENACNNNTKYTIKPPVFLLIAGGIQVGFAGLYLLGQLCQQEECLKSLSGLTCGISIFYFVWAVIGLDMYVNQFNAECQEEDIAKMVLAWCIIDISMRALICCCMFLFICCAGCVALLDDGDSGPRRGRREQDPLLSPV